MASKLFHFIFARVFLKIFWVVLFWKYVKGLEEKFVDIFLGMAFRKYLLKAPSEMVLRNQF